MRFVDEARISVKAGHGGSGSVHFRREKFIPKGGPDGGDGGNGGSVILRADGRLLTLYDFRLKRHYAAQNGQNGMGRQMYGRKGEDLVLHLPVGTMVYVESGDEEHLLTDLSEPDQEFVVAKGGRGGLGNIHFKSSTMRAPHFAQPGEPGEEYTLRLELKMRELGASGLSFDTICVSGVRSSMPHGEPSDKLIEKGDFVTMDFGCIYHGYCSDMTRTVAVGSVTDKQRRVYETVLEAQRAAAEVMKPGVRAADVDKAARDVIDQAGFKGCFGHSLGHGTGLEIHETPFASPVSRDVLQAGMTLTDEPGIYIPGEFGVRVEDLCAITENGIINFTESEKELIIL